MDVRIKETGEVEELLYCPECSDAMPDITDFDDNITFVNDDNYMGRECNQETYDWWSNWIDVQIKIDEAAEELGIEWTDYKEELNTIDHETLHDSELEIIKRLRSKK